jgi:hypothetical protein
VAAQVEAIRRRLDLLRQDLVRHAD